MFNCNEKQNNGGEKLILLKNFQIEIGIIPDLGGRIVLLRKPGMKNILKSDPTQWNDPLARPEVSAFSGFKAFNGHIVWLSPQSEWWIKLDINSERRDNKVIWPPDPYLIYGDYKIAEKTDTSITTIGTESPVIGVQLIKKVSTDETLLEMEIHGPYLTLQPVESMHLTETWQLFKYDGENVPDSHIKFINEKLKGKH